MILMRKQFGIGLLAAACGSAILAASCGSSGPSSSSGPSPTTPSSTPAGAVATTTIRIANNTATPKDIIVTRGSQVTFVNSDSTSHNMTSNPHPEHTDCPEINQVGFLSGGQSRQTGNMTTNRTICGFHDHDNPNVSGLQGSITIQ
jgi:plastocyanin